MVVQVEGLGGTDVGALSEEEVCEAATVLQLLVESSVQHQDREALLYVASTAGLLQVRLLQTGPEYSPVLNVQQG